jgi:signal transduction histidine kinase
MRVSDDGRGFDASRSVVYGGLGLLSMRERVEMLVGKFEVKSSLDARTVATVTVAV